MGTSSGPSSSAPSSSAPAVEAYVPAATGDGRTSTGNSFVQTRNFLTESVRDWVVDSGATDHVVHSVCFLNTSRPVKGMSVRLPDGGHISVTHIGTACLGHGLVLDHVLVIPSFKFNLLSVSRLTEQGAYTVSFSSFLCKFQDTRTSRMIGTAELCRGLYWLRSAVHSLPDKSVFSCSSSFFDLWHFRLGHGSLDRLCKALGSKSSNDFHCRVCPLAKQQRLQFPCSSSQAVDTFDLIHVDIWGLYSVTSRVLEIKKKNLIN
ncbi:Retrovirus-related Pol polyprotein from transposon RE2 [Linum perenne]